MGLFDDIKKNAIEAGTKLVNDLASNISKEVESKIKKTISDIGGKKK